MEAIVSHADADGIISASLILKLKPRTSLYFSSSAFLHKTLCKLMDFEPENLYILDISPTKRTLILSSVFKKTIWIDHHEWEPFEIPQNVEVLVERTQSTAALVAKILKIESPLIEIANQIDTNNVKSEEARFFRDLVSAIKWKYGKLQTLKFRQISKILAFGGLEKLEKDVENAKIIEEHANWLNSIAHEIVERIKEFEINGKKILIFETNKSLPVYFIYEKLKETKDFDILCVFYRRIDLKRKLPVTKIEIRSKNDDALKIARSFEGGGHKFASGASVNRYVSIEEFIDRIKQII